MSEDYDGPIEGIPDGAFPPEDEIDPNEKETPALSPYVAHALVTESPKHAHAFHRLLGGLEKPQTATMLRGSIIHSLLLENGRGIAVYDGASFRSDDAKEFKAAALKRREYPIVAKKLDEYAQIAVKIERELHEEGYDLAEGDCELKLAWKERTLDGVEVLCHARPDWISKDRSLWLDLKTGGGSVHPDACGLRLAKSPGVIQSTAYTRAIEQLFDREGRVDGYFAFAETKAPWCLTIGEPGGDMRQLGSILWGRALSIWARCLARDEWPPHSETRGPVKLSPPGWLLAMEEQREYDQ